MNATSITLANGDTVRADGDCFERVHEFAKCFALALPFGSKTNIVHALVSGKTDGGVSFRHAHAFVEVTLPEGSKLAFDRDPADKTRWFCIPVDDYYRIADIRQWNGWIAKYTVGEYEKMLLKTEHFGPWELKSFCPMCFEPTENGSVCGNCKVELARR